MTRRKVKVRDKVSKKLLLRLFEEGKVPTDPEVKELGYKSTTVYAHYSTWKKGKGGVTKAPKLETDLGGGEKFYGIGEAPSKKGEFIIDETQKGKTKKPETPPAKPPETPERKLELPAYIKGTSLPFRVEISPKSLVYYNIAATIAGGNGHELKLGEFIDDCIEDFHTGRGMELGIVRSEIKKETKEELKELLKEILKEPKEE